jgi:hypothetical protein
MSTVQAVIVASVIAASVAFAVAMRPTGENDRARRHAAQIDGVSDDPLLRPLHRPAGKLTGFEDGLLHANHLPTPDQRTEK